MRGVLIDFGTKAPIAGVKVSLKNKNISVTSSKDGVFIFKNLSSGADELLVVSADYQPYQQSILIGKDEKINLEMNFTFNFGNNRASLIEVRDGYSADLVAVLMK